MTVGDNGSDRSERLLRRPYENIASAGIQPLAAGELNDLDA